MSEKWQETFGKQFALTELQKKLDQLILSP